MTTVLTLFNDKSVRGIIKENLKLIQHSKINPEVVFRELSDKLGDKYTVTDKMTEIIIKPDKRKNLDLLESEVYEIMGQLSKDVDLSFMFRIIKGPSEVIIKTKRNNR